MNASLDVEQNPAAETEQIDLIQEIEELVDRLLPPQFGSQGSVELKSNLLDADNAFRLQIAIPGADPRTMRIEIGRREVTIRGRYHLGFGESGSYVWQQLRSDAFFDVVDLPQDVTAEGAESTYRHGILIVDLPKAEPASTATHVRVRPA